MNKKYFSFLVVLVSLIPAQVRSSAMPESYVGHSVSNANAFGGAIYNDQSHTIDTISGKFEQNTVSANESAYGGAIYNLGTLTTISGNFTQNIASATGTYAAGGAIYNGGEIGEILNSSFSENSATGTYAFGGAIYNAQSHTIDTISGKFERNTVSADEYAYGGAIYNDGNIKEIVNTSFSKNLAKGTYALGGAIYNGSEPITILNSSFLNNTVSGTDKAKGGAIFSESSLNIVADNGMSTFSGNTANGESNAVYMRGGKTIDLNLTAQNSGTITFDDAIDGQNYNVNIKTDDTSYVALNSALSGASTLSLDQGSRLLLGTDAKLSVTGMTPIRARRFLLILKLMPKIRQPRPVLSRFRAS
jgi:predicted outer membrane repeat protein